MADDTPLTFLQQAKIAFEALLSLPEVVSLDLDSLKQFATEQDLSIHDAVKQRLGMSASTAPPMSFTVFTLINTMIERIKAMERQIEAQSDVNASEGFHVIGFNSLLRDILLYLQFATQIFPAFREHTEFQAFLREVARLAQFLEIQYKPTAEMVQILQKGEKSGRFFEFLK